MAHAQLVSHIERRGVAAAPAADPVDGAIAQIDPIVAVACQHLVFAATRFEEISACAPA